MTQDNQDLSLTPVFVATDPLQTFPELLEGALLLAAGLALSHGGGALGVSLATDLRAAFVDVLPPSASGHFAQDGSCTLGAAEQTIAVCNLDAAKNAARFAGAVLRLGADVGGLAPLKSLPGGTLVVVVPRSAAELAAFLAANPGAGRAQLTLEKQPQLSESQIKRTEWFDARYDPIGEGHLSPKSPLVRLGEGEPQVCRYCGKSAPEVEFKNLSHAFPEQIGNKKLVDLRECDTCNADFASYIEDDFGKWSLPARSMTRIRGKKNKVPSYESADKLLRVDVKAQQVSIALREGDTRVKFDDGAKTIRMEFERGSYVPMGVFKTFVKMALAVMPEPEATECGHLKRWVLEEKHDYESFPFKPLMLYAQFIAGPLANDQVSYFLLRRKAGVTGCPYLMFVLQYANFVYQVSLPMPKQDELLGGKEGKFELCYYPHPWDTPEYEKAYGPARLLQEDLSSTELRKKELFPMSFAYQKVVDTTGTLLTPAGALARAKT